MQRRGRNQGWDAGEEMGMSHVRTGFLGWGAEVTPRQVWEKSSCGRKGAMEERVGRGKGLQGWEDEPEDQRHRNTSTNGTQKHHRVLRAGEGGASSWWVHRGRQSRLWGGLHAMISTEHGSYPSGNPPEVTVC